MRRFWFGSLSPTSGAIATAFSVILLTSAAAVAQSREESNGDNSNASARDGQQSRSRGQSNVNQSGGRASRSAQANRQANHAQLGVVFYNDQSNPLEIRRVLPDSPAEEAGLERSDEIVSVNGQRVSSVEQLKRQIDRAAADEQVEIGILRDGRKRTLEAALSSQRGASGGNRGRSWQRNGEWQDEDYQVGYGPGWRNPDYEQGYWEGYAQAQQEFEQPHLRQQGFGATYGNRTYSRGSRDAGEDEDRAFLGVTLDENARDRVRVNGIYPESPAEEAGLRRGDEIVAIDDEEIRSDRDLQRMISQKDPDDDISISVERNGRERTLHVTLASQQEVFAAERGSYRTGRRSTYSNGQTSRDGSRGGNNNNNNNRRRPQDQDDDENDNY